MAHIADCLMSSTEYGLNNFIAKELTPQSSVENLHQHIEEKEKYVWRLHQPAEPRKYQLFPSKDKLSLSLGRSTPEPEQLPGQSKRSKSKEPTLTRRRKASVSELGTMTTVQEVAMDSRKSGKKIPTRRGVNWLATIPGRPPLHERSISAPGHGWRHNVFGDTMLSMIAGPAIDEKPENLPGTPWLPSNTEEKTCPQTAMSAALNTPCSNRIPISPKLLKKLIIPDTTIQMPEHLISRCQSARPGSEEDEAPEVPPKSARMAGGRKSPKPQVAATQTPSSNTSSNTSLPSHETPKTAPVGRTETKPWDTPLSAAPTSAPPAPLTGHFRNQSEQTMSHVQFPSCHRREQSEAAIMDRGRPKKRAPPGIQRKPINETTEVPRELTDEEKAFATLPTGFRAMDADSHFDSQEIDALRRQAIGQAAKFEVLSSRDVDILSRELRALDERCEYLRKTHRSLRAGRRNLHERICSYLRSPRVARFSHSAILKQEEALVELDASIDDWVSKLEQAENRRTRVRQKLLEHVAAALTLNSPSSISNFTSTPPLNMSHRNHRFIDESHNMNTPPRSPTKMGSSPSPPRSPIAAHHHASSSSSSLNKYHQYNLQYQHSAQLSQSPQRLAEQVRISSPEPDTRMSLQSIKIYADSDVYALLADVEEEINRMGELETAESPVVDESAKSGGTPFFGLLSSATYEASS